jgi:hypothetical protein
VKFEYVFKLLFCGHCRLVNFLVDANWSGWTAVGFVGCDSNRFITLKLFFEGSELHVRNDRKKSGKSTRRN